MTDYSKTDKVFVSLVKHIQDTIHVLQQDARLSINRNLTTRAWLTGFHIVEYEQLGNDRANHHFGKRQAILDFMLAAQNETNGV